MARTQSSLKRHLWTMSSEQPIIAVFLRQFTFPAWNLMLILLHGPSVSPPEDVDDSFLLESELPADSFAPAQISTPVTEDLLPTDPNTDHTNVEAPPTDSGSTPDSNIYTVEKIVRQRLYKGKPQFEVKWKGYRQPTWEPLENILDPSLITKYYQDHPRAKNIVHHASSSAEQTFPDIPVIAAFSLCYRPILTFTAHPQVEPISPPVKPVEPTFRHDRPFSSVYLLSFALLLPVGFHPSTVHSTQFDPTGKVLTFYPDSLMLSSNPQVLVFYEDTTLVSVHVRSQSSSPWSSSCS